MSRQIKVSQEKTPGADFFRATTYLVCFVSFFLYLALMSVILLKFIFQVKIYIASIFIRSYSKNSFITYVLHSLGV